MKNIEIFKLLSLFKTEGKSKITFFLQATTQRKWHWIIFYYNKRHVQLKNKLKKYKCLTLIKVKLISGREKFHKPRFPKNF